MLSFQCQSVLNFFLKLATLASCSFNALFHCVSFFFNQDSAELGFVALITDLLELDLFILRKPKSVSDRSEALILGCAPSENCAQVGTSEHLLPLGP